MTSSKNDSITIRAEWDPPIQDGGALITSYLITVNSLAEKFTISTSQRVAIIKINITNSTTGVNLVEVQATNCAGTSNATFEVVNIEGNCILDAL